MIATQQTLQKAINCFNNVKSVKYDLIPQEVEARALINREYRELYDFYRRENVQKDLSSRIKTD